MFRVVHTSMPAAKQFVDILPSLGMTAAGNIGVRVFVDQKQARPPRQCAVQVKLLHDLVAVDDRLARKSLEAFGQLLGLAAAMCLDQAGDDVAPAGFLGAGGRQHGVGFADAGRGAEKYLQMPAAFLLGEGKQRVRRSSLRLVSGHGVSLAHHTAKTRPGFSVRDE